MSKLGCVDAEITFSGFRKASQSVDKNQKMRPNIWFYDLITRYLCCYSKSHFL